MKTNLLTTSKYLHSRTSLLKQSCHVESRCASADYDDVTALKFRKLAMARTMRHNTVRKLREHRRNMLVVCEPNRDHNFARRKELSAGKHDLESVGCALQRDHPFVL